MAERGPLPPHRTTASLRHHAPLHRGLGRISYGLVAGKESKHDQRHHQQRQGLHGQADARRPAVPLPWVVEEMRRDPCRGKNGLHGQMELHGYNRIVILPFAQLQMRYSRSDAEITMA